MNSDRQPRNGRNEDIVSVSSFNDYPSNKPFINSNYRPPLDKQSSSALPESNRDAVISALKNLQDKIRKLELERTSAESNLRALATETTQYKDMLQKSYQTEGTRQSMVTKQTQGKKSRPDRKSHKIDIALESQLNSAETRCQLLEKQLDYMRRMVHEAEQGRHEAIQKVAQTSKQQQQQTDPDQTRAHRDKISQLEKDRIKLASTHSLAQGKIKELEEQLKRERLHRQYLEEHALSKQTDRYSQPPPAKTKKVVKKKRKKEKITQPVHRRTRTLSEPGKHFRLNLAEIPFVAGQSTTPSHSVGANVQKVIALMKSHNRALCSSAIPASSSSSTSSRSSTPDSEADLADLLLQLQDEFGEMSFEHQELMKQLNETDNETLRQELESELDSLVSRMEAKSQQITKVRKHQNILDSKKRKHKKRPKSAMACLPTQRNGEVKVTTTIRTSGHGSGNIRVTSSPSGKNSLCVLKDMKKLQTTLRREDVHWDK